jgi:hypothetical protein
MSDSKINDLIEQGEKILAAVKEVHEQEVARESDRADKAVASLDNARGHAVGLLSSLGIGASDLSTPGRHSAPVTPPAQPTKGEDSSSEEPAPVEPSPATSVPQVPAPAQEAQPEAPASADTPSPEWAPFSDENQFRAHVRKLYDTKLPLHLIVPATIDIQDPRAAESEFRRRMGLPPSGDISLSEALRTLFAKETEQDARLDAHDKLFEQQDKAISKLRADVDRHDKRKPRFVGWQKDNESDSHVVSEDAHPFDSVGTAVPPIEKDQLNTDQQPAKQKRGGFIEWVAGPKVPPTKHNSRSM